MTEHHPLKEAQVIDDPSFHEYVIIFKDNNYIYPCFIAGRDKRIRAIDYLIEEEYIWHFKQDEIENNGTILQSVRYEKVNNNNVLKIKFSGPEPDSNTINWIDTKIDRLMKKVAQFSLDMQ